MYCNIKCKINSISDKGRIYIWRKSVYDGIKFSGNMKLYFRFNYLFKVRDNCEPNRNAYVVFNGSQVVKVN